MKATDLIVRLQHLVKQHGDMEVFPDAGPFGLLMIDEIDVDVEDTGIIIWAVPKDEQ